MKTSEVMSRTKFVKHRDKMILNFDFSGLSLEDCGQVCAYVKGMIVRMPKNSVLTLVNVTDISYDAAFRELSADLAEHNKPYVVAGAVVGVSGWRKLMFWAVTKLSGRSNLQLFDDEGSAKEWLAAYTPR
jgi:hypothetical protein